MKPVTFALLALAALIACTPAAFWLRYGTFDACDAYARAAGKQYASRPEGRYVGEAMATLGVKVLNPMRTPRQCFEGLWQVETGRG